jgi:multidrug efflux pump
MAIVDELRSRLGSLGGIEAFPANLPALSNNAGIAPVSLVVQGPDVAQLAGHADEILRRARGIPGLVNLQTDLLLNKPQIEVAIDRDRASDLGVSVREIARALQILFGGLDLTTFKLGGETYDVIAQLSRPERSTPRDLYGVYVRSASGSWYPSPRCDGAKPWRRAACRTSTAALGDSERLAGAPWAGLSDRAIAEECPPARATG